jgi:hypothetical protein
MLTFASPAGASMRSFPVRSTLSVRLWNDLTQLSPKQLLPWLPQM